MLDETAGFDAEDAGEGDRGSGEALAGEELGAVETAGFHADKDLAGGWGWHGEVFELEDFGAAGGVDYGCFHCEHGRGSVELV